ncbi:hypothetical protein [Acinetobacter sp. B51(2017)]|uniref:hypothetical protein n=1 Tax=Acinetobacter sp. B51(2017) TaxID=2060938 RepID=UPI000F08BE11|nr:hypothetical protein [Acinetobacter sp. B51(2017)]
MIGQQRQILTDLGIDLWIPRDVACQNFAPASIWRDQTMPQQAEIVDVIVSDLVSATPVAVERPSQPAPKPPAPKQVFEPIAAPVVVEPVAPAQHSVQPERSSFELQLLDLADCAIVVDASQLSTAAQQLWLNINHALQADYQQLNWPFPLLNLQDANGAQSYLEGFLDAHSVAKPLFSLGQLPYLYQKAQQLPSLEDMLAQPSLKRQLWQHIYNNKQG